MKRRFVRIINAGKVFQLAGSGLLVQPFRIALFTGLDGGVEIDFDKWQFGLHMEGTNRVAIFSIGTYKARHGDSAAIGKKLGHFADAANVLFPIRGGEAKVLVKPVADIIAVENISQPAT